MEAVAVEGQARPMVVEAAAPAPAVGLPAAVGAQAAAVEAGVGRFEEPEPSGPQALGQLVLEPPQQVEWA